MSYFFFRQPEDDNLFFDEGPRLRVSSSIDQGSGSIDTSALDPYRQGVEITQQKHFDAAIVKIHAGEPGHMIPRTSFAMDRTMILSNVTYKDLDYFNPEQFIRRQDSETDISHSFTFPIVIGDNYTIDGAPLDGIIEPFTIRARAAFYSIEAPFESHEPKGALMAGNCDQRNASDVVASVYKKSTSDQFIEYLDMADTFHGAIPTSGYFTWEQAKIEPFIDARIIRNASSSVGYDSSMTQALNVMTGSTTDNYVPNGFVSATSGWDYGADPGTDSIAFGGMTH